MVLRVLVADGHPQVRMALAERLGRAAAIESVLVAATLEEAIICARQHAPHVVLCDPLSLGDAEETVRRLEATGARVVALVASIEDSMADTLRRAGARAILLKGVSTSILLRHLADAAQHGARSDPPNAPPS